MSVAVSFVFFLVFTAFAAGYSVSTSSLSSSSDGLSIVVKDGRKEASFAFYPFPENDGLPNTVAVEIHRVANISSASDNVDHSALIRKTKSGLELRLIPAESCLFGMICSHLFKQSKERYLLEVPLGAAKGDVLETVVKTFTHRHAYYGRLSAASDDFGWLDALLSAVIRQDIRLDGAGIDYAADKPPTEQRLTNFIESSGVRDSLVVTGYQEPQLSEEFINNNAVRHIAMKAFVQTSRENYF